MQTCGNTSLPLRFSSDFLVSTKCKVQSNIFAVQSFRNSPAQCFKPAWYSNLVICLIVLLTFRSTCHCLKQFREGVEFLVSSPLMIFWPLIILKL